MKRFLVLPILLGVILFACTDGAENLYEVSDPSPIEIRKSIPGKLEFIFRQSIIPNNTLSADEATSSVKLSNLSGADLANIQFFINIYSDSNFKPSNLLIENRETLPNLDKGAVSDSLFLTQNIFEVLRKNQIEVQLLKAEGISSISLGGTYRGEYFLEGISKGDTSKVGFGTVKGYINWAGRFSFNAISGSPLNHISGFINEGGQLSAKAKVENLGDSLSFDNIPKNKVIKRQDSLELFFIPKEILSNLDSTIRLSFHLIPTQP
ncbi:MAG: hypothetical protein R8P61_04290 [Bacteroidia bacterium]|nr:hypothetical protein [Bacteroidia bacterium]